jgi:hypothetical protein
MFALSASPRPGARHALTLKLAKIQLDLVAQSGRWCSGWRRHENDERAFKRLDGMGRIASSKIGPSKGVQIRSIGAVGERDCARRQLDRA